MRSIAFVSLVSLTTVHGAFTAHVLAARLASEGIDVQLRGAVDAAYGLTVGDMARVDVFVPEDQIEDARLVLLAAEVDDAMEPSEPSTSGRLRWTWVAALVLIALAVAAPILRSFVE